MINFDEGVNRLHTNCEKWDNRKAVFGREDVIPLWVADMDFATPDGVIKALTDRARHGAFGYTYTSDEDLEAVIGWMKRRHGVDIAKDNISFSPGVVDSLNVAVAAFTKPGDSVALLTPIYPPFYNAVDRAGCKVRRVPLLHTEKEGWMIDFEELEKAFSEGVKAMPLCNPHNPLGRIWAREELEKVAELAHRYGVQLFSDEIHSDLEMPGHRNTSMLLVDPDAPTFVSTTKTFNLAALRQSSVLIKNPEKREIFLREFNKRGLGGPNLFGLVAQTAAYQTGEEWLNELIVYLDGNRRFVEDFLRDRLPGVTCSHLMGTYLMWLDFRAWGMNADELDAFLIQKAGVGMYNGRLFGDEGKGFMRLNIAIPRKYLAQGFEQIEKAFKNR